MRRNRGLVLVFGLISALAAPAAASDESGSIAGSFTPTQSLTFVGPNEFIPNRTQTYSGLLTLDYPVGAAPGQPIELRVDGVSAAKAITASDGTYSASVSLQSPGPHTLQALAYAGTPVELQSPEILATQSEHVLHLAAGRSFTCALMSLGTAPCWGDNTTDSWGTERTPPDTCRKKWWALRMSCS
jgi:hypothetical protein